MSEYQEIDGVMWCLAHDGVVIDNPVCDMFDAYFHKGDPCRIVSLFVEVEP